MSEHESISYRGQEIKIYQDDIAENPIKEWGGMANFRCYHRDYDLSNTNEFEESQDLLDYINSGESIFLPLYLYDHSGITISAILTYPYNDRWDAGQVGFVYEKKEDLRKEFGWKLITKQREQKIINRMLQEVNTFDQYLRGYVYRYNAESKDGKNIGSCCGFFGYEHEKSGLLEQAKSDIDWYIEEERKKHAEYLKRCISGDVPLQFRNPAIV